MSRTHVEWHVARKNKSQKNEVKRHGNPSRSIQQSSKLVSKQHGNAGKKSRHLGFLRAHPGLPKFFEKLVTDHDNATYPVPKSMRALHREFVRVHEAKMPNEDKLSWSSFVGYWNQYYPGLTAAAPKSTKSPKKKVKGSSSTLRMVSPSTTSVGSEDTDGSMVEPLMFPV